MGKTALQLIQKACYYGKITPPSSLVGATDSSTLQLLELFYETGRELRECRWWPQLKRKYLIRLESGRDMYPLPLDFYAAIPETQYDLNNNWQMNGALGDGDWNERKYGYVTIENRKAFRVFGPDININSGGGQFHIDPIPGDSEQGLVLSFEYLSKNWLTPPLWTAGTTYGANVYVSSYGNIYQKGSGSTAAGTVPPNIKGGVGRDGGVEWLALPTISAWAGTTVYPAGRYVTKNSELYLCTIGGTSGGTGPVSTVTGTTETDGTVTWKNILVGSWTAQTSYLEDDHILISSQYYKCVTAGKTSSTQPTWTQTTVSDGAITWTAVTAEYEELVTDSDLCLFDDDLIVTGLAWRFLRSQGVGYQDLLKDYSEKKQAAVNRYQPGTRFSLVDCSELGSSPTFYFSNIG